MTGLLLAFTGRAVAITNQYDKPYCVAHAVATCGSLYGYKGDSDYYADKLNIGSDGYNVRRLPQALYKMRIGKPKIYTRGQVKKQINKGPMILNINENSIGGITRHAICAVGYDDNYLYYANSRGTGRGIQGYGMIASGDIQFVTLQTLGDKTLTPSLIVLTDKKEGLQESKPVVKSPITNARNTKKLFLTPLD